MIQEQEFIKILKEMAFIPWIKDKNISEEYKQGVKDAQAYLFAWFINKTEISPILNKNENNR